MLIRSLAGLAFVAAFAGSALADVGSINSVRIVNRNFNDFPGSTILQTVQYPTTVDWDERFPAGAASRLPAGNPPGSGGFANRHFGWFSADSGATNYSFQNGESFTARANVLIQTGGDQTPGGNAQPRREAGFAIFNPQRGFEGGNPNNPIVDYIDEGFVMVASDGEVAMFGGRLPFFSFNSLGDPNARYFLGTSARIEFRYFAPDGAGIAHCQVAFTNFLGTVFTSPVLAFDAASGGPLNNPSGLANGTNVGLRAQNQRNPNFDDFSLIRYNNISVVPTPGAAALIGIGGLLAGRRRRA